MDDLSREDESQSVSGNHDGVAEHSREGPSGTPPGAGSEILGRKGRVVAFWGTTVVMAVVVLGMVVTHQAVYAVTPIMALVSLVDPQRRRDLLEAVRGLVGRPPGPGP